MTTEPNSIVAENRRRNQITRDNWERCAPHRKIVTELLIHAGRERGDLCVLGAGNCTDLDLAALAGHFQSVVLGDLDHEALESGVTRQEVATASAIETRVGDASAISDLLSKLSPASSQDDPVIVDCLQHHHEQVAQTFGRQFDVVASTCLLTQLLDAVKQALGEAHPRFLELLLHVRNEHLRSLVQLASPGGQVILITDFVSSDTFPPLRTTSLDQLPQICSELLQQRNFFTGVNPLVLLTFLQQDPTICDLTVGGDISKPWLWDLGPRVYAVCTVRIGRHAE